MEVQERFRNPNSFLYAAPQVTTVDDPELNFVQTYDLYKRDLRRQGERTVSSRPTCPSRPTTSGRRRSPTTAPVMKGAVRSIAGGGTWFVGRPTTRSSSTSTRSSTGSTSTCRAGRTWPGNQGGGKDDISGFNTHSFVLQVPESEVTRDGRPVGAADAPNAASASGRRPSASSSRSCATRARSTPRRHWVQVSRLGNPLINEVIIPIGAKDKFNRTDPADDAPNFGAFAVNPEPARPLNALFGLGVKETDRTDIVQALLTGVPGLTQISPDAVPADTLKLNPAWRRRRPRTASGSSRRHRRLPERPPARRRRDDIELRVIAGALLTEEQGGKQLPLGDGVDRNDKPFGTSFPYVAPPTDGFTGLSSAPSPRTTRPPSRRPEAEAMRPAA